ncbi:MAG: hypothetical protein RTU30_12615 [Candidatus Thorarchaeota archaeon]
MSNVTYLENICDDEFYDHTCCTRCGHVIVGIKTLEHESPTRSPSFRVEYVGEDHLIPRQKSSDSILWEYYADDIKGVLL